MQNNITKIRLITNGILIGTTKCKSWVKMKIIINLLVFEPDVNYVNYKLDIKTVTCYLCLV